MSGASSRRRAAFTLTPPRRLEDSPLPMPPLQRQQQQQQQQQPAGLRSGGDATPVSKLYGGSPLHASTPAPSPVLQPLQQPQKQWQRGAATSPGSPLLASCFKSTPALAPSPFADLPTSQQQQRQQQEQQPGSPNWTLPAGRPSRPGAPSADGAGSLDSPRGSAGRRRSAVITTSSPLAPAGSLDGTPLGPAHRPAAGSQRTCEPAAGEDLLAGLKAFSLDSPSLSSLTQPADSRGARTAGGGAPTHASLDELRARMARVQRLNRA